MILACIHRDFIVFYKYLQVSKKNILCSYRTVTEWFYALIRKERHCIKVETISNVNSYEANTVNCETVSYLVINSLHIQKYDPKSG